MGFFDAMIDAVNKAPRLVKLLFGIQLITVIGLAAGINLLFMINFPKQTIRKFQIWRLITYPFVCTSILNYLIGALNFFMMASERSREMGARKYAIDFFIKTIEIGLFHGLIGAFVLNNYLVQMNGIPSYGIFSLFFLEITARCMRNPNQYSRFCFMPCEIPNKIYPLVLYLLFCLLMNSFRIDWLVAIIFGVLHVKWLDKFYEKFLTGRVGQFLDGCFACFDDGNSSQGASSSGGNGFGWGRPQQNDNNDQQQRENQSQSRAIGNYFQGKGIVIGESSTNESLTQGLNNNVTEDQESLYKPVLANQQ